MSTPPDRAVASGRVADRVRQTTSLFTVELTPARIAVIYLLLGMSFLFVSDVVFVTLFVDPLLSEIQAVKGAVEVLLTGGLIFLLTRQSHIQLNRANEEIKRRSNVITVLGRVLRHNLRNNMTVIRGQVSGLQSEIEEPVYTTNFDAVLNNANDIIDLAEKARELESTVSTEYEYQPIDVGSVVNQIISEVETEYPSATVTVDQSNLVMQAKPSLEVACRELIENAAKHSGDSPAVTVSIERTSGGSRGLAGVEIVVSDDGPGLPGSEQHVLEQGSEEPLIHGSGLGLYTVYWVVTNHGGTIDISTTGNGTTISLWLPANPTQTGIEDRTPQSEFQRMESRFEAVFEEASDAMLLVDDDGRFIDANEAAADLLGLSETEILGRTIGDFAPPDYDVEPPFQKLRRSGQHRETAPLVRADGDRRIVEYAATSDIVPGQHLAVLRDVTDRIKGVDTAVTDSNTTVS